MTTIIMNTNGAEMSAPAEPGEGYWEWHQTTHPIKKRNDILNWATGNDEQVCRSKEIEDKKVGQWTLANATEPRNGENYPNAAIAPSS